MSLALASKSVFENREGGFSIFTVQTLKCAYRVCVGEDNCVKVQGPGVDYEIDLAESLVSTCLESITTEGKAILAVLIFEEGD